jgi:hypothetical protein
VTALLTFLGIVFAPLGVTWAVLRLFRAVSSRGAGPGWSATRPEPASRRAERHDPRRLDRLRRDLARLEQEYRTLELTLGQAPPASRSARLHALGLRYDETLVDCCAVLGLPAPGRPPLEGVVRLQVEASLAQRGVSW